DRSRRGGLAPPRRRRVLRRGHARRAGRRGVAGHRRHLLHGQRARPVAVRPVDPARQGSRRVGRLHGAAPGRGRRRLRGAGRPPGAPARARGPAPRLHQRGRPVRRRARRRRRRPAARRPAAPGAAPRRPRAGPAGPGRPRRPPGRRGGGGGGRGTRHPLVVARRALRPAPPRRPPVDGRARRARLRRRDRGAAGAQDRGRPLLHHPARLPVRRRRRRRSGPARARRTRLRGGVPGGPVWRCGGACGSPSRV
ncbi:MAG: FIG00800677: hypothetical protein, partial [uncultured Pseudonocardia sp.]